MLKIDIIPSANGGYIVRQHQETTSGFLINKPQPTQYTFSDKKEFLKWIEKQLN